MGDLLSMEYEVRVYSRIRNVFNGQAARPTPWAELIRPLASSIAQAQSIRSRSRCLQASMILGRRIRSRNRSHSTMNQQPCTKRGRPIRSHSQYPSFPCPSMTRAHWIRPHSPSRCRFRASTRTTAAHVAMMGLPLQRLSVIAQMRAPESHCRPGSRCASLCST